MDSVTGKQRTRLVEDLVRFYKAEIRKFKSMAMDYYGMIMAYEAKFPAAWDRTCLSCDVVALHKTQAMIEVPLIKVKDHLEFIVEFLNGMIPAFERDYRPQEPYDNLEGVKNRFR